ncbi:MAG: coproporphyrinogen dehydrogenase HemZ [Vulcanibacillus sp.]
MEWKKRMKFIVKATNINFNRQIENILNLFNDENGEENTNEKVLIDLQYNIYINNIIVTSKTQIKDKIYYFSFNRKFINPEDTTKIIKKGISIVLLKLLEQLTDDKQGWGILTGIRPLKLYHSKYNIKKSHVLVQKKLSEEYLIKEDKIILMSEIAKRQLSIVPNLYCKKDDVSIYIGIPYCPTKCVYCTFPSYAINRKDESIKIFLKTINKEIQLIGRWLQETKRMVSTIYFGGGTPTSLEANELDKIFANLANYIDFNKVREVTVESGRPDTITVEKLDILNKWKVDRISVNPQSFTQKTLDAIGRNHTVDEVIEKFNLARSKGIKNINMDLIIGLPGENLDNIRNSFSQVENLDPDSLTIHTMAFKTASYLAKNREEFTIAGKIEINKMMDYARNWSTEHGYYPYYLYRQKNILGNLENIGYSKKGKESLYNILMMEEKQTIIALGCGAVSKLVSPDNEKVIRLPNPKDPKTYSENIEVLVKNKIEKLDQNFLK